ncbi:MAG: membrane protein insertase, yidc/oxa1 family, preprotein translocase subunit YidC [Microgenomates group bacterium GW2011_GWC1_49_7]|nr:MAG: membrane protein insertase, yidc/oxa1 family, preprotein translocase subunit YidC [Microgenomates group bacterium GW2011_GWC1_49_7]
MTNPNLWNQLLIWPIVNVLVGLYKLFEFLHIPGPLGFAVIGLTVLIRVLLYPLMAAQLRSAKKMSSMKPHMDALALKHKGDKQGLQQAQLALYKEHGVNPAAGCLPLLIQMPVLIALYNVFYQVLGNGNLTKVIEEINQVVYVPILKLTTLDLNFLGANLGVKPSQFQTHGYWLLLVPIITAGLQYWQTKLMMPPSAPKTQELVKKDEKAPGDMAGDMQKQMAIITPLMFGYFALQFPLGLALYWNVFGIFGILQQLRVNREK